MAAAFAGWKTTFAGWGLDPGDNKKRPAFESGGPDAPLHYRRHRPAAVCSRRCGRRSPLFRGYWLGTFLPSLLPRHMTRFVQDGTGIQFYCSSFVDVARILERSWAGLRQRASGRCWLPQEARRRDPTRTINRPRWPISNTGRVLPLCAAPNR